MAYSIYQASNEGVTFDPITDEPSDFHSIVHGHDIEKVRENLNKYIEVAVYKEPEVDSLEAAFAAGNRTDHSLGHQFAPMRSVSVGDVIRAPDGKKWLVGRFGFEQIIPEWATQ